MATAHLRSYIEHYFAPHPSAQVKHLFASRAIMDFATGMVALFEPIYLHSIGYSLVDVLLFYAAIYALYLVLLPVGGMISRRHGYEHGILFSTPFLVMWYLALLALPSHWGFAVVAVLAIVFQKILYWPGYHANFATWSGAGERGRELSTMVAIVGLASVTAPAFGGLIIATFGYTALFFLVAGLILLSNLPLLRTPEVFMPHAFSYPAAVRRLVEPERRRSFWAYFGIGEELLYLVAWPLFLAIAVADARMLGAIVSGAMLVNVVVTLYVGRLTDGGNRAAVLRSGVVYTALAWVVRSFVTGGFGAFLVDSYYQVAKNMVNVPMVADRYDVARGDTVMEEVVFFEMALSAGKLVAALLAALMLATLDRPWTFIFAMGAAFTVLYTAATSVKSKN